jgi:hypothetical protein
MIFILADNRVMPPGVDYANVDSGGWWYKPETLLNHLNVNSVITSPGHEEFFRIRHGLTRYTMRGYAYAGGGREVRRVEVTLDGGKKWIQCQRHYPKDHLRHGINSWVRTRCSRHRTRTTAHAPSHTHHRTRGTNTKTSIDLVPLVAGAGGVAAVEGGRDRSARGGRIPLTSTGNMDWQGGLMTQHIESLKVGDKLKMKGPAGHVIYHGRGYSSSPCFRPSCLWGRSAHALWLTHSTRWPLSDGSQ